MSEERLRTSVATLRRTTLATLPTPLEIVGELPGGRRLLIKRDDLTGLGMGGNKARKLEFLAADAQHRDADLLVTVGAAQSNHARMTAATGARLGIETHLVLGGRREPPTGNQLLSELCGATLHFPGTDDWDELELHMGELMERWRAAGRRPYAMPIGGSTPVGACGFVAAWSEVLTQCEAQGVQPQAIVHASSSGGTHAGLLAGRAMTGGPDVLAIGVAKTALDLTAEATRLAAQCLHLLGSDVELDAASVEVDERYRGEAYAVPTNDADAAIRWAARRGGWILDRTYTAKAMAGLLDRAERGDLPPGDVIFWHTGGQPALFAPGGAPTP
jgi:1-aminocyclopropane-1-carboxylate deaminase/D-cysteine desulfhydrase-like pyridoxal-dependent ACC family enzyme